MQNLTIYFNQQSAAGIAPSDRNDIRARADRCHAHAPTRLCRCPPTAVAPANPSAAAAALLTSSTGGLPPSSSCTAAPCAPLHRSAATRRLLSTPITPPTGRRYSAEFFSHVLAKLLVLDRMYASSPPSTRRPVTRVTLLCMSAFAFDGLGARAQHRAKAARWLAVCLVCAGCCVVGAASVGAGVHQAQGADMFEQLAFEMKVCSRTMQSRTQPHSSSRSSHFSRQNLCLFPAAGQRDCRRCRTHHPSGDRCSPTPVPLAPPLSTCCPSFRQSAQSV
jgi:hypothetical protein